MNNDLISRSALPDDLISKRVALDALQAERILHRHAFHKDTASLNQHEEEFSSCMRVVCDVPFVDAEVVRHGRWYQKRISVPKGKGQTYLVWACSLCHKHEKKRSDYCPNCGAKMDEGV